ncbi:MAG: PHP domain-containing protein [Anaerolineales bacterium]|nr:PHP domain-containing protein [Anaerolineales bacterium]
MHEYIVNLHMHSLFSDGTGTHAEIAQAAYQAGIDAVIVTDHNLFIEEFDRYWIYTEGANTRRVLMIVGEEVHNQAREPQKNHLLVLDTERELAQFAPDPARLLEQIAEADGLAFLAHIVDPPAPAVGEGDLSWVNWEVSEYTGIELWNSMSEFKSLLKTKLHAIFYAFSPKRVARGPFPESLKKWDELLATGRKVVAVGGSDAHAMHASLGPLKRVLFPYAFHFQAINTHILTPKPLTGNFATDRKIVLDALRQGHCFIGYDLPAPTRGFHFQAHTKEGIRIIGDEITTQHGVTFQISLPQPAECHLLRNGRVVKTSHTRKTFVYNATEPGVYRVEAYIQYKGRRRGWIFSNPIYISR